MLSFRQRLALIHSAAITAIVACAAFATWWGLSHEMNQQLDQALLAIADAEVSVLNSAPDQPVRVHDQQNRQSAALAGTAGPAGTNCTARWHRDR
jgi:two-component system OmpR family sensor kinase